MKSIVYGLLALFVAQGAAGETVERSAKAAPDGDVEIVNVAGDVHVIGWDRAEVRLSAEVGRGVEEVEFEQRGDRTSISVKAQGGRTRSESTLRVHVPRDSTVVVNTVSASQTLEGVHGEQRLQSVSGSIRSEIGREDFQAKTVSGEIDVTGNGPTSVRITSVSGSVELKDVSGELDMNTVNGSMRVIGGTIDRARLKTTNGEVRFDSTLNKDGRLDAEAINGSLAITLRGGVDADFNVETFNGSIRNCFGPKPERTNEYAPGSALRFKEGKGSARVRLKTLNGGIELCRQTSTGVER